MLVVVHRLLEKMCRQLRQRLRRKMRRDGVILHGRAELVTDLFVDGVDDFLVGEHKKPFVGFFDLTYYWPSSMQRRRSSGETQNPAGMSPAGLLFWRRPIDSFAPAHSPFGL